MADIVAKRQPSAGTGAAGVANLIGALTDVTGMFTEKKSTTKTSGGTQTSGLDISQEGVDKVLSDILSGTSGLAEVSSGQKRAGLYNSSVNQQLTNDLTSRAAGETAKLQAKTVTTTSPTQSTTVQAPQVDPLTGLAVAGGGYLANKALQSIFSDTAGEVVNNVAGTAADSLGSVGDSLFGSMDFLGDAGAGFPVFGTLTDLLSGDTEDALAGGAGYLLGNSILPGVGGIIGSLATEILPIGDIFGGIEDVAGDIFGGIGDLFGGLSVVCTELHSQGIMSTELYMNDTAFAALHMNPRTLIGYRFWGVPLVKLMRKSKLVTRIAAWFAVSRAHYIASIYGKVAYDSKLAARGKVINSIGVPICNFIAEFVEPTDVTVLYPRKAG